MAVQDADPTNAMIGSDNSWTRSPWRVCTVKQLNLHLPAYIETYYHFLHQKSQLSALVIANSKAFIIEH